MSLDENEKKIEPPLNKDEAMNTVVRRLEDDLMRTRENLRATIEQHEISTEELKASNEELQAINEELRSASEELETSKEELQSVNEELITVNSELKEKIDETTRANSDLQNLMSSTNIATIFLDRELLIKRYTPLVENIFNITPLDVGRPIEHFTHKLDYSDLSEDVDKILRTLQPLEREISSKDNKSYLMRFLPYRTVDDRIEGVVINFLDITALKYAEETKFFLAAIVESSNEAIITFDFNGKITSWNKAAEQLYGYKAKETIGKPLSMLTLPDELQKVFANVERIKQSREVEVYETVLIHKDKSEIHLQVIMSPVRDAAENVIGISTIARVNKAYREGKLALHVIEERFRAVVNSATDYAIFTLDENNKILSWSKGAEYIFGWKEKEVIGSDGAIIFTPQDREKGEHIKELETARRTGRAEDERWHIRKDGTLFYASGMMMVLHEHTKGYVKICRDQTEKVKSEAAQRDKEMLKQFVSMQEDERRRIARDIHDQFGQQMTSLRMKLGAVKKMCGDQKVSDEIDAVDKIAEQLDREIDFISWELRPASLDDLGLRISLANFVREWSHHSGIKAEFQAIGFNRTRLPFETETNLYRIAQEALNNIQKHSKAKNVSVLLERHGNIASLIVEDDGVGFNPKDKRNRTKGVGLIGMSERARIFGGELEIESGKGKGTTVYVRIPLVIKKEKE